MTQPRNGSISREAMAAAPTTASPPCALPVWANRGSRTGGAVGPGRGDLHAVASTRANGPRQRNGHTAAPDRTDDPVTLTRELVGHVPGAYILHAHDDRLGDAQVHRGDSVLLQRDDTAASGELVAVRLPGQVGPLLRRIYFENGHVRLQPEDRRQDPLVVSPGGFEIEGRVVAIIRQRP